MKAEERTEDGKLKAAVVEDRPQEGLFRLGLALGGVIFAVVALWGVWGFGGETLPEKLARISGMSFKRAAILVSVGVGLWGTFILGEIATHRRKRKRSEAKTS